ncbi:mediator subunit 8 isoform X2 [Wolffia australiana]
MEVAGGIAGNISEMQQQQQMMQDGALGAPPPVKIVEPLNPALQQQLNLESVKTRAQGLYKAISRILEDFDIIARSSSVPKWHEVLGQFSMVNLELFNIVEDIKKVSKAFVVHPKNVNADNATILPVMISSKLLPEMEVEDNTKKEQLLYGMQGLPIPMQIEKLKARIDMIGAACESAEKVISDARKSFGLGSRQSSTLIPTLDKAQAAKIQEQENVLRAAVNYGEGLRLPADQRQPSSSLPLHLMDVFPSTDGSHGFGDAAGANLRSSQSSLNPGSINSQGGVMQVSGTQFMGRSVQSPGVTSFENASTPPPAQVNSPRSSSSIMNIPSPLQQTPQQQQRQKIVQLPQHQQQLLAQQQLRQSPISSVLGQSTTQFHDLQGQGQQKFQTLPSQHQMQYPQPLGQPQFQNRPIQSGHIQHNMASQSQIGQGNQLRSHLGQFSGPANTNLFNAVQSPQHPQMYGLSSGLSQRNLQSQMLGDQTVYSMGGSNPSGVVGVQQQQGMNMGHQSLQPGMQGMNAQGLQPSMAGLQSTAQNPQGYGQPRQQGQP